MATDGVGAEAMAPPADQQPKRTDGHDGEEAPQQKQVQPEDRKNNRRGRRNLADPAKARGRKKDRTPREKELAKLRDAQRKQAKMSLLRRTILQQKGQHNPDEIERTTSGNTMIVKTEAPDTVDWDKDRKAKTLPRSHRPNVGGKQQATINMPVLRDDIQEVCLSKWKKLEGDNVTVGEIIAEVKLTGGTDISGKSQAAKKAVMEEKRVHKQSSISLTTLQVPATHAGKLEKWLVKEGDLIRVGASLARLETGLTE